MLIYVATKNGGKLRELRQLFAPFGWRLETYIGYADVAEGDTSYAENAALKAAALHAQLRSAGESANVLGDDSGLEVSALGGRPGVLSARYGGAQASWHERRAHLLAELAATGSADRSARFVCALHFIGGDGRVRAVLREVAGTIASTEAGERGFSYDPIFWYPPAGKTFAELTDSQKNRISHRGLAARALVDLGGSAPGGGTENERPPVKSSADAGM